MTITTHGLPELNKALAEIARNIKKPDLVTIPLVRSMTKFVHVDTGYLKSTIYRKTWIAGADAPYAGYEADRSGEHDYAERAIEDFDIDAYLDSLVDPF